MGEWNDLTFGDFLINEFDTRLILERIIANSEFNYNLEQSSFNSYCTANDPLIGPKTIAYHSMAQ